MLACILKPVHKILSQSLKVKKEHKGYNYVGEVY